VVAALVGVGYWGPNLARNLQELPEAELVWICDRDSRALEKIGRRYPGANVTTNLDDVLADDDVEAVLIATPVATHGPLAASSLEAGKHVFVEKPLAASSHDARALITLAAAVERVLMPGHTFLYSPPVCAVADLIRSGELGEIYFISTSRVNLGLHQPDVSVIWDLGPHDFSILRYWMGENPLCVSAFSRGCLMPHIPDVAFVNLDFGCGAVAHVELSWLAPSKLRRTTVVGSRKMVVYDDMSNEPVRVFDSGVTLPDPTTFGEYRLTYRSGDIVSPRIEPIEPLFLELRDFCAAIRTGATPRSSAEIGHDIVSIVEAAHASLATGSGLVPVRRLDPDVHRLRLSDSRR
jgi:predicted dehydrogenase